jgi:acetyltransferase
MLVSERSTRVSIRQTPSYEIEALLPHLSRMLSEIVLTGNPMGFLPPLSEKAANDYWRSIKPELEAGTRILLTAHNDEGLLGTGQLALAQRANGSHRAEIEKLFVTASARGQGIGSLLMNALHATARRNGRSLIVLNTRNGLPAVGFYKSLGYKEVGVIPGWAIGVAGERYDHIAMYHQLREERVTG